MVRRRKQAGQAMTEFALVVPLLLIVLFGIIEIGILLNIYIGLTNSAREGARAGAIYQETAPITTLAGVAAMDGRRQQSITTAISATLNPMINTKLLTTTIIYTPTTPVVTKDTFVNYYRAGNPVTVQIVYTHKLFWGFLGSPQIDLRARSTMLIEPGGVRRVP